MFIYLLIQKKIKMFKILCSCLFDFIACKILVRRLSGIKSGVDNLSHLKGTRNSSMNSKLSAFVDTLEELNKYVEGLAEEPQTISLAPFCDVTRRISFESDTNKFATDLERHVSELGLTVTFNSEARRQEEFEVIMLASKANFEATIVGMTKTADLKDDIQRYVLFLPIYFNELIKFVLLQLISFNYYLVFYFDFINFKLIFHFFEIREINAMKASIESAMTSLGHQILNKQESDRIESTKSEFSRTLQSTVDAMALQIGDIKTQNDEILTHLKTDLKSKVRLDMLRRLTLTPSDISLDSRTAAVLGQGGFGTVYQGEYLGQQVAVKVLNLRGPNSTELLHEVENEVLLAKYAGESNPNIVRVFGIISSKDVAQVVMELSSYGTLSDIIFNKKDFPVILFEVKLAWISDLCVGVEHMHRLGIIHKDIKPQNILICGGGVCKINDFGLSKQLASMASATAGGHVTGTIDYLAPEILNDEGASFKSDIYSLEKTFLDILIGVHVMRGVAIADTIQRAVNECPPVFAPAVREILLGGLNRDKTKRFSAVALKENISSLLRKSGGDVRAISTHEHFVEVEDFLLSMKRQHRSAVAAMQSQYQTQSQSQSQSPFKVSTSSINTDSESGKSLSSGSAVPSTSSPQLSSNISVKSNKSLESLSVDEVALMLRNLDFEMCENVIRKSAVQRLIL